jgi:hypothetical protein
MIPMKFSHPKLTSLKMPQCVECFVLLHSPIIIDMKKLETIRKETNDDIYTLEMSDFFSTAKLVTGCIFKVEGNSFSWID